MQTNDISLDKIKDGVINSILNDLTSSGNLTPEEAQFKRQELEQLIKSKQLITQQRIQGGVTNAQDFNDTIEELYIDLLTTFKYVNSLGESVDKHVNLNQAAVNTLKSLIHVANDRMDTYEVILSSRGNPSHYIEGFRNADSFEESSSFYTERNGEIVPMSSRAYFNPNEELVSLNYLRNENVMAFKNGVSLGEILIKKQLGSGLIRVKNDVNSPECMIDTSMQSYWSESILCDSPLRVKFDAEKPTNNIDLEEFYYGIQHGALCELELNFEAISLINEISLIPYGQYPMEIVAIKYKTSDDMTESIKEIVCPDNLNPDLRNISISGPVSFRFPDTACKKVYVLFNQIHYVKSTFIYNPNEIFKNELWFSATNSNRSKPDLEQGIIFAPNYFDRAINDNAWTYINNMVVKDKYVDLKSVLFGGDKPNKSVTKYQYTYGFYNIATNHNEFERTGVYVSKVISASDNIQSVQIITDESHPHDGDGKVWTDIEHYISYSKNPSASDWLPILPANKRQIDCELLQSQDTLCYLRFRAARVNEVCIDGTPLVLGIDYSFHFDGNGYFTAINIPGFDQMAKYTVSYEPIIESSTLNLVSDTGDIVTSSFEVIDGVDESYYTLTHFPYISTTSQFPTNIKIIDKETGVIQFQDTGDIICVTNPYDPSEGYRNFDRRSGKIQYYVDRNQIYFNQTIDSNKIIEVNYNHCVSDIRLKAILRRNNLQLGWITPTLTKVQFKFVTA